ncbi:hypothetical protein [Methylobacterium komagatae]
MASELSGKGQTAAAAIVTKAAHAAEAPAAPRSGSGVTVQGIAATVQVWTASSDYAAQCTARAILALLQAPRPGGTGEEWSDDMAAAPRDGTPLLLQFAGPFKDRTEDGIAKGSWHGNNWWLSAIWAGSQPHTAPIRWKRYQAPSQPHPAAQAANTAGWQADGA